MKINYKSFPILEFLEKPAEGFMFESLKDMNQLFEDFLIEISKEKNLSIDYITEPIRQLVDHDIKVGDKLHRERDSIENSTRRKIFE